MLIDIKILYNLVIDGRADNIISLGNGLTWPVVASHFARMPPFGKIDKMTLILSEQTTGLREETGL